MTIFSSKGQRLGGRPHNMSALGRDSFLVTDRNVTAAIVVCTDIISDTKRTIAVIALYAPADVLHNGRCTYAISVQYTYSSLHSVHTLMATCSDYIAHQKQQKIYN